MPLFRHGQTPPGWCELTDFEIVDLRPGDRPTRPNTTAKTRILCTLGTVQLFHAGGSQVLKENQFFDFEEGASPEWHAMAGSPEAQLVFLSGRWGGDLGGCGVFRAAEDAAPSDGGDPVAYAKKTKVDSHYHDCDEYWIILDGRAAVVVGDTTYEVERGDCVPIGMGHHHDLPLAPEPVKAVFFETTLERGKRIGHLWNHTHGTAEPHPERI